MKLELGYIFIKDISFLMYQGEDGTLYVNKEEVKALILEDQNFKS